MIRSKCTKLDEWHAAIRNHPITKALEEESMKQPLIPFLDTICSCDGIEPPPARSWKTWWSNVYPGGYGYARQSREDAEMFRSSQQPILYRIKVTRK